MFARDLVENAVSAGFGSLSKRDLELLVFWLLERDGVLPRDATSHDVARRLSVTVAKARAFRRDADARWGRLDPASQRPAARVQAVLQRVLEPRALDSARRHTPAADRADGFVELLAGHPADRDRGSTSRGSAPRARSSRRCSARTSPSSGGRTCGPR